MTKMQPMDQSIESITKKLQADSSEAPMLLLQRAQLYADKGDEANAKADIASAASLVKEPQHRTDQAVAAVERAFRDIAIRPTTRSGKLGDPLLAKYSALSVKDLVETVVGMANGSAPDQDAIAAAGALASKADASGKLALDSTQICILIDAFHTAATTPGTLDESAFAKNIAQCIKSVALSMAADPDSKDKASDTDILEQIKICTLREAAKSIQTAWKTHDSDGSFKQLACRYGASMYMAVAYAMSTYLDPQNADLVASTKDIYNFYIQQVWMVGTLQVTAADEIGEVSQGILRLLTANRPLFVYLFVTASDSSGKGSSTKKTSKTPVSRLLHILGTADESSSASKGKSRSLALLIASQLVAAAKDPANSVMFPEHDPSESRSRAQARLAPTAAIARLRSEIVRIVDEWIQSTIQSERSCGLFSAASLYEGGVGSDLLADLWLKSGWAEDLWDQGEFDKPETQLSLLRFADSSSTDVSAGKQMKNLGNGLVQELAKRKVSSKRGGAGIDAELAASASVVLAKWSGVSAPASQPDSKKNDVDSSIDQNGDSSVLADVDPIDLANIHIERISDALGKSDLNKNASTDVLNSNSSVEKATEALGFMCLKPKVKEHVAHNEDFLKTLFALGQKTASVSLRFSIIMLIRNLTMYKPVLSEEQKRMQQLQRLGKKAQSSAGPNAGSDSPNSGQTVGGDIKQEEEEGEDAKLDAAEFVSKRSLAACKCGGVSVLVSSVHPKLRPSDSVKDAVAEIMVSLATTQALRGLIVQQGGIRALLGILTDSVPKATAKESQANDGYIPKALLQKRDKDIAFSLAKIAISVPPNLAFQDPREIVQLLLSLLLEDSETHALLMKFESLLALTNLASMEPGSSYDVRDYIAISLNGISSIEILMLSDHPLVRRAATELLCNLVYSPKVFDRYVNNADKYVPPESPADDELASGELLPSGIVELPSDDEDDAKESQPVDNDDTYRSHRLHLLVALADVDDTATRSAAAGALAILSNHPQCCRYLFLAHPRACDVLVRLANDTDGTGDNGEGQSHVAFKHRVAVIWANAANCGDARVLSRLQRDKGVLDTLKDMASDRQMPFFAAAADAIQKINAKE
ncbi:SWI5-dependent HO expression protein 4 [Coemansia sp. RSA 1813]|nr:SWI5-dependent HO expression protein 4 [Coemansia sp. RSA 1646]KAJ1772389.1 SWI5-dependent HO expression protein 4 [Coemansia sp. RSA 1843]KAJ2091112.1 SWI5-dependent HO expression protein 4 [Coemansia sp. RSA 986]KAJ2212118.1 SWI5-dependent HO expression protein 4 [Coemansia sp. RSA 487]KAJ2571166.1 SWI5-dependent HO expression protein 4 [Coemansia sp. RSA 1813]